MEAPTTSIRKVGCDCLTSRTQSMRPFTERAVLGFD
jgi:hypothetical protein